MPIDKSLLKEYESSVAAIEPTPEDLKTYRRMGLDNYVSPSGQRYPLVQDYFSPPTQKKKSLGINKELLESFEAGEHEDVKKNKSKLPPLADPDQPLTHFADPVPPTGISEITDPQDISLLKPKTYEAPTEWLRTKEVPEVLGEIEKRKPIGVAESIKREGIGGITKRLPFVGPSLEAMRNIEIGKAAKRLQAGDYKQMYSVPRSQWTMQMIANPHPKHLRREDEKLVTEHFNKLNEESRRDKTFWAKVGSGAMDLAPWMIEFAATGGLSKLGSAGTQKFGTKLLGEYAKTKTGQLALRSAGWLGGSAARTTVGLPGRVAEQYTKRKLPEGLTIGEQGQVGFSWPKEKSFTSFAKAWGNVFIEAASEEAGEAISGRLFGELKSLPFGKKFIGALSRAWTKLAPKNTATKFWKNISTKAGYSNLIGEIGEERLATIMHSIARTEDFGTGKDANVVDRLVAGFTQDVKNFPVEATVLSIPGATRFALGKATGTIAAPRRPTEPTTKPEAVEVAPENIIHKIRKMTPEEIAEDEAFWANFDKIKKAVHVPTVEALSDTLGKRIDLLKKVQLGILTQQEADALTKKFADAAKLRIEAQPVAKSEAVEVAKKIPSEIETLSDNELIAHYLTIDPRSSDLTSVIREIWNRNLTDKINEMSDEDRENFLRLEMQRQTEEMIRRKKTEKPPSAVPKLIAQPVAKPEAVEVATEAEKPPAKEVRGPTEHLVAMPRAKGAREIEPAKGETILIENPEQKGDYQKYEDFGTGILRRGNKLFHKASLKQIEKFSTVKNARKAAQTLAQEDIDFELEDVEKIRTQFQQWRTEKGDIDIEAYLIGKGKELEGEDYPEIIRTMAWVREKDTIISKLKNFVSEVPEFALNPVLTYKEGYLVFSDGYRFKFMPDYFGINKESLVEGDKIRFDLENLGIKKPSAKKLKAAEIWTGEPKIMGREAEKPIPVEQRGRQVKPRKLTAEEETYERSLTDIETGKEVEVEGGVTYKAVSEDDIRRVAELGRKAGRQAWTVERDILSRQERGTAETKMDIGEAIKIIRNVFAAKPLPKEVEPAKPKVPAEELSEFIPPAKPKLSFDEDLIRPADVKHIKNVVVDTFRDWPKGIKKVGKDYWIEVMAVAKQLATPYRYRALRQTMLGVFRHKKKPVPQVVGIEIQDVTDALTATHELGHNIDWLLNNKIFPSSIKGRFPNATVGEMSLRNELKKISKVLRPDAWERPKAYIKSHVELMADFISHYILDPEKTREIAPNLTRAFEAKLADKPELFDTISRLQESRYTGPEEPAIAEHIREVFPLPKEFTPLKLAVDMTDKSYVKAAEELGITAVRHYKLLIQRAQREADRIDDLVPDKARQTDLVVVAEKGSKNPWTGKTREEILKDALTAGEQKAINLFRAYQEKARQTVNKYLRGADITEYIKFIEDYFIHAYETPLTEKYKTAIARWAKRSPQAKKRVLPDLAKSVEIGLKPRAKTLSEGLKLWAGINYRVMTNKAFLRVLPQITNDDGVSILQKPQDYPSWPTVDYWPIRQNYAIPLPNRGVLLFQGRVAVDPRVKPFIDAMFGRKVFNTPVRIIEGLNATWKAFQLTLFSFFHHQAEFFSACGSLGPRAMPFVGGYYGKRAQVFGKKPKLWGFLPAHITVLKAGKQLEQCPEFMDDYLAHGGQRGYISTEGINLMERMLKRAADYLENIIQYRPTTPLTGVYAAAYVPVKTAQAAYSFHQSLLWDNVNRAKLVSYYKIVADGAKYSDLPIKEVKELAVEYINDNFGGQEWLNTMFRDRKTRQFWTQLMMSLDWTWSQIKTARWPLGIGGGNAARRAFMRKRGREHWFWYLAAISSVAIAGSFAFTGKGPWDNEVGHKLNVDWTKIWRSLPWNRDWKERGDYARRYTTLGKAGRELVRWITSPLRAFGYKLSPVARSMFEQTTGYNIGSDWAEPWAREDLQLYQEVYARFKHLMENFKPFAFSGNNAFLALPSRKGMTQWKATRAYEEIYKARAIIAMGGIGGKIAKANQILKKDEEKLKAQITEACELNNVDASQADRAALSGVRSKYCSLFWKATKMPEKKAVSLCNAYANALHELGITPKGFKQSMMYRIKTMPERAREIGLEAIQKAAAER